MTAVPAAPRAPRCSPWPPLLGVRRGLRARAVGDKPVRFILPIATGSGVDTITRAAQPALPKALGAPVVVDNQPGAGGIVGMQALVQSPPDGLTLSVVSNNLVIFPSVLKSLPFDPVDDITPIAVVGSTPMVLVVNPNKVPANNAQEFVALLKAKPDEFNFASSGNGTILHLAAEMFLRRGRRQGASTSRTRASARWCTDLIGGQVDFGALALPSVQAAPEERRAARHRRRHRSSACRRRRRSRRWSSRACRTTSSKAGSR